MAIEDPYDDTGMTLVSHIIFFGNLMEVRSFESVLRQVLSEHDGAHAVSQWIENSKRYDPVPVCVVSVGGAICDWG